MALVGPKPISIWYRSPMFDGRGDGEVFLSAARSDATSPGSNVGLRSKSWTLMVGRDDNWSALSILGLLKKPMLLRSRSWV